MREGRPRAARATKSLHAVGEWEVLDRLPAGRTVVAEPDPPG
ncbi:hypothetical protein [Streptomyces prasinosporus]